jgi:hypothetical protein
MGQRRLKWASIERYLRTHGYEIRPSGGDKIIIAPRDNNPEARPFFSGNQLKQSSHPYWRYQK